ncbi:MAG: pyruvate dehydrogenase (acetyl-transferring) E1 component subunit alpha [Chloroflexi bacterium RBG_16_68_14]|nr:MAG: pyruvate dehydrogenase (acetyl-transferring) E1 component subunit alpha [Chloroflexi bacterium RBG_16_68_14]
MTQLAEKPTVKDLDKGQLIDLLRQMMLIRRFEEKAAEMYARQRIAGFLHLYIGEEAVAAGAIAAINHDDYIISHYREHGHALARGVDPGRVMAELFGRETGVSGGRGGSMHLFDVERFFMGGYAIVAGHLPIACGLALANQRLGNGRIVLCIFGDGAVNEGEFHEALNLAAVWKLPVLFLCENNFYGMGTDIRRVSSVIEVYKRARAYAIPAEQVNGMNVLEMYEATQRAARRVRSGQGPVFLEAITFRFRGHSMADPESYRRKEEVQEWRELDPIVTFRQKLEQDGVIDEATFQALQAEVEEVVNEATRFAEESPKPPPEALYRHVYEEES